MANCLAWFWMTVSITQKLKILDVDAGKWKHDLFLRIVNKYHSIFMIYHPDQVGPMDDTLFDLILDNCFHDSKTQNFGRRC